MKGALTRVSDAFCNKRTGRHKKVIALVVSCFLLAFLFSSQLSVSANATVYHQDIVDFAYTKLGCPYDKVNNHGPDSFDCSGFVNYVFLHFGISLSYYANDYYSYPTRFGTVITNENEVLPGDIVAWSGHVGICIGNGKMINAKRPGTVVKEDTISRFQDENGNNNPPHIYIRVNGVSYSDPIPPAQGTLDLNGLLDGWQEGGLLDYGTCDVYINGSLAADRTNTTDYVDSLPAGTTYSITNIKANEGFSYDGLAPGSAPLSGTIQSGVTTDVFLKFNSCKLDVNGWLDNEESGTLLDYGTFDLYVNGVKIKDDIDDFWDRLPKGATYEIKDIKAAPGHVYNGPHSGSLKGTIVSGRTNVSLSFSTTGEISSDWITVDKLPGNINSTICDIQVKNHYSTTATTSPGSGWVNQGVAREEWVNSGEPYDVYNYPLETSASRECLSDIWFHFCGPNAEGAGNYEQTGNFVHWDAIDNSRVTGTKYLGNDNGNPYYFIYVDGSSTEFYCQSGITCDGSYGQHGARCRVWYRLYRYQDKVKVTYYNFTKDSNWTTTADSAATSVTYRYRLKSSLTKLALPANLTVIEDEAFAGTVMNAVIVPDGCTAIGSRAFANCSELVFVSVPKGTVIAADAFEGCGSVTVNER